MMHVNLELIQYTAFQPKGTDKEGGYTGSLLDVTKLRALRQVYKRWVLIYTKHCYVEGSLQKSPGEGLTLTDIFLAPGIDDGYKLM